MITVTVIPKGEESIYKLMINKELELRKEKQGTLHRYGAKGKGKDQWFHTSYKGWIRFQSCYGGVVVALVRAKNDKDTWQLLTSLIGFLHRHFKENISGINLSFGSSAEE
jgi:hypothetical protein